MDSAGNIYVTGQAGTNLPTTPGAFLTSGSGPFVAELNPTGTAVLYATYLGNGQGAGSGITVDAAGDTYVIGKNLNVPTTANALASSGGTNNPPQADFVAELNPIGSALLYSTYIPGSINYDFTNNYSGAIAVDSSGNIYLAGAAEAGLPVTANAFQTDYLGGSGGSNAFFMKINPALAGTASVLYASYLGGSGGLGDAPSAIALDGSGNAYLYGYTTSSDFPTTSGAFERTYGGGLYGDAFVAKFDPALSGAASLVFSTYLGGSGSDGYVPDQPEVAETTNPTGGIAVDSAGNIYVTGATTSTNFPTTPGAYQTASNIVSSSATPLGFPPSDVFVTKLNPTGSALVYSTYIGGGGSQTTGGTYSSATSVAVDSSGNAYLTGWTDSPTFPTVNPVQAKDAGLWNAFVTTLNAAGSELLFSTYLGGSGSGLNGLVGSQGDYGYSVALDAANNVYVSGWTTSSNFPTTAGAYQTTPGSGFVTKINLAPSPSFAVSGFPSPTAAGVAGTVIVTALNANGTVNTGYTGTVQFSSSDPQAELPANYTFTAVDQGVHTFTATLRTAGSQSITATDTVTGSIAGSEAGITVTPAAPAKIVLSAPSSVKHGTKFSVTVTIEDAFGNVVTGYLGTIHFSSSDSSATLPHNYTFTASDAGVHTFTRAFIFRTRGKQTLTVTDTQNSALTATDSIQVG